MQKREAPKEIAKGHELAWLRLRYALFNAIFSGVSFSVFA